MAITRDPVSTILRNILRDPAVVKILTIAFSGILIVEAGGRARKEWHGIPLIVIYSFSLIYSAISLAVTVFKKEEAIGECRFLKTLLRGRTIFWHEFQTAAAFTCAISNLSGVMLGFAGEIYGKELLMVLSFLNTFCFGMEWLISSQKDNEFIHEQNPKLTHNICDCFLGMFSCCPLFFNIIRKACFIGALALLFACKYTVSSRVIPFYLYCIIFAIVASFLLFLLQISKTLEGMMSTKTISGRKWQTYLLLAIAAYSFLGVLNFSLVMENKPYQENNDEFRLDFQTLSSPDFYKHHSNKVVDASSPLPTTATPSTPAYIWHPVNRYVEYNAPLIAPLPYVLSCIGMALAMLDLYSRAIRSQSRLRATEATAPLQGIFTSEGITKLEDIPIVIASPSHFTDPHNSQVKV